MSSSSIFNLHSTNPVAISYHNDIQCVHPSLSKNMVKQMSIQPLDLYQFIYEEMFIPTDQDKCPKFILCDVSKHHCRKLMESICKKGCNYSFRKMAVFFTFDVNTVAATAGHQTRNESGKDCQHV